MKKDRVAAFTDAVLAIIMTILVLELEKPEVFTLHSLWELRYGFLSYTLSFFWLGSMWINIHNEWDDIETIHAKTLWITLVLLFFSSMIPYATSSVSQDFNNVVTQCLYGFFVLGVTFSNIWLSQSLQNSEICSKELKEVMMQRKTLLWMDVGIKLVGLVIAITIYPPAMMISVLLAAAFLMRGIRIKRIDWIDIKE